jgi:hypothetical protein
VCPIVSGTGASMRRPTSRLLQKRGLHASVAEHNCDDLLPTANFEQGAWDPRPQTSGSRSKRGAWSLRPEVPGRPTRNKTASA